MKTKNYDYPTYKTIRQWALEGYLPNQDAAGIRLYSNKHYTYSFIYYGPQDVRRATQKELQDFFKPERDRKNARRRQLRQEKKQQEKERELAKLCEIQRLEKICKLLKNNNILILDVETTGLDVSTDEILQLSIIDFSENILFNEYFKPVHCTSWDEAESINGISPEMVADKRPISDNVNEISEIVQKAEVIIGYNIQFDLNFLSAAGVQIPEVKEIDIMEEFAEIYGEWSKYFGAFKWQKLTTAADYYGYDWNSHNAHDSLADCFATLYCTKKIFKE